MDELTKRAQMGDRQALEELLAELAPRVRRFGRHLCGTSEADDVTQDTLLSIMRGLGGWEGRGSLTSWVFALTRSACARRKRGKKNEPHVSDDALTDEPDLRPTPEDDAERGQTVRALDRALDRLSEDHREVLLLRDVEGFTAPQAAEALGVSIDALKSRLHRARGALRAAFEEESVRRSERATAEPSPATPCPDVVALWSQHLEGDVPGAEWAALLAHLGACASCESAYRSVRGALEACRASGALACSEGDVKRCVRAALAAFATGG